MLDVVDPVDFLERSGGVAGAQLLRACGRSGVRRAVTAGLVVQTGRARFALPSVAASLGVAHGLSGVLSHLSAARFWGWEVKSRPDVVDVVVPRNRAIARRPGLRRRDLPSCDVTDPGVTTPLRTVLDVATDHAFDEAVAVADSALRSRLVTHDELIAAAVSSAGRGHARRLEVVTAADPRADNPFESVLRALAIEAGLSVVPQVPLFTGSRWVRPDLLDESRALALEAESFTWHGARAQLARDCTKYNALALMGLTVVRFAWEQVFLGPAYTRAVLRACADGSATWRGSHATRPDSGAA